MLLLSLSIVSCNKSDNDYPQVKKVHTVSCYIDVISHGYKLWISGDTNIDMNNNIVYNWNKYYNVGDTISYIITYESSDSIQFDFYLLLDKDTIDSWHIKNIGEKRETKYINYLIN